MSMAVLQDRPACHAPMYFWVEHKLGIHMMEYYIVMKRDELETEEKPQTAEPAVSMPTADSGDKDRVSRQSFYFCDVRE